jgi:SAM-dependent methyltransferase
VDDVFGRALLDHLEEGGDAGLHVIERDDGYVEPATAAVYFGGADSWDAVEASAAAIAGRAILDVGAGAGRHSLAFQTLGKEVIALDPSPGAAEVCRRRGVKRVEEGTIETVIGRFDTFTFFGNNLGMLAAHPGDFFPAIEHLAMAGAVIIGTTIDPYRTEDSCHLRYHEQNRSAGRLSGSVRLRLRYRELKGEWFDLIFTSRDELASVIEPYGWRVAEVFDEGRPIYGAALQREPAG